MEPKAKQRPRAGPRRTTCGEHGSPRAVPGCPAPQRHTQTHTHTTTGGTERRSGGLRGPQVPAAQRGGARERRSWGGGARPYPMAAPPESRPETGRRGEPGGAPLAPQGGQGRGHRRSPGPALTCRRFQLSPLRPALPAAARGRVSAARACGVSRTPGALPNGDRRAAHAL